MIAFIVILSFVSFTFTSQFQAKTVYGNISCYDAIGRVGYDGKVLGKYDCALKLGFDNPPKGTKITVTETKSYRFATVYKWDMGNLPDEDKSVAYYDLNEKEKKIVAFTFSVKEDYQKIEKSNQENQPLEPTTMHLDSYNYYGQKVMSISTINKFIGSLHVSNNKILFTGFDSNTENSTKKIYLMEYKQGTYKQVLSDQNKKVSIINLSQAKISKDGRYMYFIGTSKDYPIIQDKGGIQARERAIYVLNQKTKDITRIWYKKGGIINNFEIN